MMPRRRVSVTVLDRTLGRAPFAADDTVRPMGPIHAMASTTLFPALAGGERINEHGILKRSKRRIRIPCSLMSMLLLLSRARASDVYRSSVRLPDILRVADTDGSGTPSGHLRVPIHVDPDTTPRSRGSIHPCRLWGDPPRSVRRAPTKVKNIKVSTDIPPFYPLSNRSSAIRSSYCC